MECTKQLVPSRSKISALRKEEIATMLKILYIDNEGYKRIIEPKLYNALMQNPKLAEEDLFKPLFISITDPRFRTNSQKITPLNQLHPRLKYRLPNRQTRTSNTVEIKQESHVGIKKEELDTQSTEDVFQRHYGDIRAQQAYGMGRQTGTHNDDDYDTENNDDYGDGYNSENNNDYGDDYNSENNNDYGDDYNSENNNDYGDGYNSENNNDHDDGYDSENNNDHDDDYDSENNDDDNEENYTMLEKSISFALDTLENVDQHARRASRHWTKVLKKQYKNLIKTIQLILSQLVDLVSKIRLSLSTISSIFLLFLLIEAGLLAIPLVQKHLGTGNTNSELVRQNFEKELIQPDYSVIESSSLISYPIFTSLSSFFTASTISTWNPLFFWALFLVTIPALISFFFNLTRNYYTKKQQQVYHQLDLQYKFNQSVAKRTRSHTSGYDENLILSDSVDQDPIFIEPTDKFELVIDSPYVIDPLVFAMTRIALIYFFYSISTSSTFPSTFITTSSFAVKSTIGNLPYLHSIFSVVISLYVVSL